MPAGSSMALRVTPRCLLAAPRSQGGSLGAARRWEGASLQPAPCLGLLRARRPQLPPLQHAKTTQRAATSSSSPQPLPPGDATVSPSGAFIGAVSVPGRGQGPLAGVTFAAKDIYDIEGFRTGAGNPTFRETHGPADGTAPAVQALLDAGASLVGKATMDELAYSIAGENVHYGTPTNPAAPGRIPGGSSSGSAVAVGGGECDLALGSDTAGSVRVPAAFCGVLGFRPSHGRVSLACAVGLAPCFDTAGLFAPTDRPHLLREGMLALLATSPGCSVPPAHPAPSRLGQWMVATDAFELAEGATATALFEAVAARRADVFARLGEPEEVVAGSIEGGLGAWFAAFRTLQARDVWATHGAWVTEHEPTFGPGVRERFRLASEVTEAEAAVAAAVRDRVRAHMDALLTGGRVLAVPAAPVRPLNPKP